MFKSDKATVGEVVSWDNDDKQPQRPERVVFHMDEQQQDAEDIPFVKGEVQPLEYRDVNFARFFYLQFAAVTAMAIVTTLFGSSGSSSNEEEEYTADTTTTLHTDNSGSVILWIFIVSVLAATVGVAAFLTLMMTHSEWIVRVSFFAAPSLLLAFAFTMFALDPVVNDNNSDDGLSAGAHLLIYAIIFAVISACVYHFYQKFIPFAASTLQVASMAVRANRGLYLLIAFMPMALIGWFYLWLTAVQGVFAGLSDDDAIASTKTTGTCPPGAWCGNDNAGTLSGPASAAIILLVFSFYFTRHVIINVFHVTTAGTVGAWWFTPLGDSSLCNKDVMDSLHRSLTYSFGSICFGSLVVAIVQTLEHMARRARRNRNGGALLACLFECILHFLRRWIEYFNSWAFCYVGLYGYDFLTAGKNVVSLFKNRGWSSFVADRLVFRVLYFSYLAIAIVTGGAACLTDVMVGPLLPPDIATATSASPSYGSSSGSYNATTATSGNDLTISRLVAFFIGFLLGLLISHTALFVLESAVRTVIVCFAESPAEFYECHPDLCELMRQGWAEAYPEQWTAAGYEEVFMAVEAKVDHNGGNQKQDYRNTQGSYDTPSAVPIMAEATASPVRAGNLIV